MKNLNLLYIPFSLAITNQILAASSCEPNYCLGPEHTAINPSMQPNTCNGDFTVTVGAFYWMADQDGMEYAIEDAVSVPIINPLEEDIEQLNNLIQAQYATPNSKWAFGYKLGIGYQTPCDGWDLSLDWLHYANSSSSQLEANPTNNHTLITLWSAFSPVQGGVGYARDIETTWKVAIDLIDFELGRDFWNSRRLSMRPFIGLRYARVDQDFTIEHRGGSWSPRIDPDQDPFRNEVSLENNYKGVGLLCGLDSLWHFGCGWGVYAKGSGSILYGRFSLDHKESNCLVIPPYSKTTILQSSESLRSSKAIIDLALGLSWTYSFCECKYLVTARFGFEQYLFFNQNQMWRVVRVGNTSTHLPNNTGENLFNQRRGSLSTQGLTLSFYFDF